MDEALASFCKAIEINPRYAHARAELARTERLAAARDKLPVFQNGSDTPASNAERLGLAEWCQIKNVSGRRLWPGRHHRRDRRGALSQFAI